MNSAAAFCRLASRVGDHADERTLHCSPILPGRRTALDMNIAVNGAHVRQRLVINA
jgi:hypothetical protein